MKYIVYNGISFFRNIYSLIPEILKFLFKNDDDVTNRLSAKINHKIENISGNIGVMLLKLQKLTKITSYLIFSESKLNRMSILLRLHVFAKSHSIVR